MSDFEAQLAGSERFRIYVPPGYDSGEPAAAVLFLHGAGERGSDSAAPTRVGIGPALRKRRDPYPAFVIFPQCPRHSNWSAPEGRAIAAAALDAAADRFKIDDRRIALTGISMGAAGAWLLAAERPEKFVSLAPVCGWVTTSDDVAGRVAHIPTWIVHGDADNIVPVDASRLMYEAMLAAGADVRYDELRGVEHNSWDFAYQKTAMLDWLINPAVSNAR